MTKYLGIDYGQAHVGLAWAETNLATPLISLPNNQALLQQVQQIVEKEGITKIIKQEVVWQLNLRLIMYNWL